MGASITSNQPKTLDEVKEWFFREGLPVTEWAKAHGFRPEAVYALLAGRTVGRRGQAHRAAIALGLKRGTANLDTEACLAAAQAISKDTDSKGDSNMP